MKSGKSIEKNPRIKYLYRQGKIIGGESTGDLKNIVNEFLPTSLSELCELGRDALKVGLFAAVVFGAVLIGRGTHNPKEVRVYGEFLSVDKKHTFAHDPNLSEWDPNSETYFPKVYTAEKYNKLNKNKK